MEEIPSVPRLKESSVCVLAVQEGGEVGYEPL
jgi:hypothetical protein